MSLLNVRLPSSPRFCADREEGSEAVSPVAIVWPCPVAVDAHVAAGREVGFPRPDCPSCAGPLVFWSGYRRYVREAGRSRKIFVPRLRCAPCGASHALLPAFTLAWRHASELLFDHVNKRKLQDHLVASLRMKPQPKSAWSRG